MGKLFKLSAELEEKLFGSEDILLTHHFDISWSKEVVEHSIKSIFVTLEVSQFQYLD